MTLFCRLLPLWALLSSLAGYYFSTEIAPLEAAIIPLLTIIGRSRQNILGSMLAAHWSRKPATDS